MTAETQRILTALHQGVGQLPYEMLVRNKAGDVATLINEVWAQVKRADVAETRLAAAEAKLEALQPEADAA
jgi:hypothetical protein